MNYLTEIRLFNEWLETSEVSTSAIALWYALMHIANRSGWREELCIPVSALCLRTKLSRSAIYKERNTLRECGLIDFDVGDGRQSSTYRIIGFEERFVSTLVSTGATQRETQTENRDENEREASTIVSTTDTQECTQNVENHQPSTVVSTTRTQPETQNEFVSTTTTQPCTIYKQKDISLDGNQEKKKGVVRGKKRNAGFDLSFIGDEMWEGLVESWLEYKRSRSENYKSELSVKKFHTMLRNLSRGDPALARQIIDKSIANNWAGIFELSPDDGKSRNQIGQASRSDRPATGQRIGQIKQPEDEERRRKLLEKFDSKK
jgi:DNA-binding transcriptional ArsR family regulator